MNLTPEQWKSLVRLGGAIIGSVLIYAGFLNQTQVGTIVNALVDQAPAIVSAVSSLILAGTAVWGIISHSNKSNVTAVIAVPGQAVLVGPKAPAETLKMAADRTVDKIDFVNPNDPLAVHL